MNLRRRGVIPLLLCAMSLGVAFLGSAFGQVTPGDTGSSSSDSPIELTADQLEFDQVTEIYDATGSVVVVQGAMRLTGDHVTLHKLSGALHAEGHVHVRDATTDVWSEELDLNLNTETGIVTHGEVFQRQTNSFIEGARLRRYSETHYRVQDGSFTNCDAKDGETPAWRFRFRDMDFDWDDSLYGEGVWFHINDVPVLPLPTFRYPLGSDRKTGLLIPTVGLDNVFGFRYQQGLFWPITPSQDLTISPLILTKRGGGGDVEYRYVLNRRSRGNWLVSTLYDTDQNRTRADISGAHVHVVNADLSMKLKVNYSTDRSYLQDLSSSGVVRTLPSQESVLNINQRLPIGTAYLLGQYLQPLTAGGATTFQRLPEVGYRVPTRSILDGPLSLGLGTTFVHFFREEGFQVSRLDVMPHAAINGWHVGHVVGIKPQIKLRSVSYSRGLASTRMQQRTTYWAAMEARSYLSRRFAFGDDLRIRHSIEPRVMYEFVPQTRDEKLVKIDAIDTLNRKSLVTYSLSSRLTEQRMSGGSGTWLDLFLAQSYHVGDPPALARRFSDIWGRATVGRPLHVAKWISQFRVAVDSFYDPSKRRFSQWNTDLRLQMHQDWYVEVGQRYARAGPRVRRGDIWNPISFNDVLAPQPEVSFVTLGGAVQLPLGLTVGGKVYRDVHRGENSEVDIVGLYQNPCRCFSFGLYYIQLPDRTQYNFLFSLTGLWGSEGSGTGLMRSLLSPLLGSGRGVPWGTRR